LQFRAPIDVVQSHHLRESRAFEEVVVAERTIERTAKGIPVAAEAVVPDDAQQALRFGFVVDDQAPALQQSDLVGESEVWLGVDGHGKAPREKENQPVP
jgi:hypothetical protein